MPAAKLIEYLVPTDVTTDQKQARLGTYYYVSSLSVNNPNRAGTWIQSSIEYIYR